MHCEQKNKEEEESITVPKEKGNTNKIIKKTNKDRKVEQRNMNRYSELSKNKEEDIVDKIKEGNRMKNDAHTAKT